MVMIPIIATLIISQTPCLRPEDFRTQSDGSDWAPAIQRAIESFSGAGWGPFKPDLYGGCIQLGFGSYQISKLTMDRSVVIQGVGGGGYWGGSLLRCMSGQTPCIQMASPMAQIRDVTVMGQPGDKTVGAVAIELDTRAKISHIYIHGFTGHCVYVNGNAPNNANGWSIDHARIDNCGGDGIRVEGMNANAGMAFFVDVAEIQGIAFNDLSFLGNSYFANQAAACKGGSYSCPKGNQRCVFVSNYTEADTPVPTIASPSMWLGGLAGLVGPYMPMNGAGLRDGNLTARDMMLGPYRQLVRYTNIVPTSTVGFNLGDELIYAYPVVGACGAWRLARFPALGTKWKCVQHLDAWYQTNTYWVTAPPTSTNGYNVGDTMIMSTPQAGQCERWRLTKSGWRCASTVSQ